MVLKLPSITGSMNVFKPSPNMNQVGKRQGSMRIPSTITTKKPDEYVVDAAGNGDYLTIAEALTALGSSSGTIRVLAGTYTITSNISLAANQSIIGSGYGTNITTTSNITLITLTGNRSAIYMCRIDGNSTGAAQIGINITGDECIVRDCWITQMGSHGIYCNDPQRIVIEGCRIDDVEGDGISSAASGGCDFSVINDNYIDNADDDGIAFISSNDNVISGNQINNCDIHGIHLFSSTHNIITGNHIFSNGDSTVGDGIQNDNGSHENVITGNHISHNNDYGIKINATSYRTLVVGNIIYTNGDGEISDGGTSSHIAENIVA